ncbi:TPA: efflux RND transporter periplasmic adaptor subunit [bacterium]|nr:efflux RND transporter periplasmic adaptor subunit [bacterium]
MKRFIKVLIWLAVAAVAIAAIKFFFFREKPIPVSVFKTERGAVEELVVNSHAGTIKSRQRAQLSPGISGTVAELTVRKGDFVEKEMLLLRLEDSEYRAGVEQAEKNLIAAISAVNEARLALEQSERELKRQRPLAEEGAIPAATLETYESRRDIAKASLESAEARIKVARAQLDGAKSTLAKTRIYAPFSGVIAEISTEVGEWLSPSPPGVNIPAVIDMADLDSIYVSAPLDEIDLAKVKNGLPVRISVDAFPDSDFLGYVYRIAPYVLDIEKQNRTFEIEAVFNDPSVHKLFLPGATADVEVILERHDNVLRIPTYAILEEDKVLVIRNGKLAAKKIQIGLKNWEFTEIVEGLSEGDEVVVSLDRAEVKEGALVFVE